MAATAADFSFSRGGADVVGSTPNEEATTTDEEKSARSLRSWLGEGRLRRCGGLAVALTTSCAARLASAPSPSQRGSRAILRQAPYNSRP